MTPLLFLLALAGQSPLTAASDAPIADNSFLVEEAFNQERNVVQHISVFERDTHSDVWTYNFTQEWPFNPAPRHQLSYTLGLTGAPSPAGTGVSDFALNWRYQLTNTDRLAIAPRVTLLLPTGNATVGRGAGGPGVQVNLPISVSLSSPFVFHTNAGMTLTPSAKDEFGDRSATTDVWLAQSAVWQTRNRFNVLVEALWTRSQYVAGPDQSLAQQTFVINPGVRWAYDLAGGLQVVPGVSLPVTFVESGRTDWGVLGYLSLEHPFHR